MQYLEHDGCSRRARVLRHHRLADIVEMGDPKPRPDLCTNATDSVESLRTQDTLSSCFFRCYWTSSEALGTQFGGAELG